MSTRDLFESISPVDYRYWDAEVARYLSENGFTRYKLKVEVALVTVLYRRGLCHADVVQEVAAACDQVTTAEVYKEEKRIGHDLRALVNCIRARVSDAAKPFVHMTATSFDISDTANAARFKDVIDRVVVPQLTLLEGTLITLALREVDTLQVGRTHGQHAVPITFGFAIAEYVSRLGHCIEALHRVASEVVGKFSGAVGAYNASRLFFDDPEQFEREVLAEVGLTAADYSTQIVPPEPLSRLLFEAGLTAGVLANLADDMRHLQRTEIGEVGEEFGADQVGSSTMPQKRNPINFENAKSCWKIIVPRLLTVLMDQLSEHQRDLTNSASARTYGEVICYLVAMAKRLNRTMGTLQVDPENVRRNFTLQQGMIVAEPLYILLAAQGHPDAHEVVRQLTLTAQREQRSLQEVALENADTRVWIERFSPYQRSIINDPSGYTGRAAAKAGHVARAWAQRLGIPL